MVLTLYKDKFYNFRCLLGASISDLGLIEAIKKGKSHHDAWREEQDFVTLMEASINGADFSGLDLNGMTFDEYDMMDCNFTSCNLANSSFTFARLCRAKFDNANLNSTIFTGANLLSASFKASNLSHTSHYQRSTMIHQSLKGAEFSDCFFGNADFRDALLGETRFLNCDLGYCVGLDECKHNSPSCLDFRTLAQSGYLPVKFLRGVGLPDPFINNIAPLIGLPFEYFSCFISYSSSDAAFARQLYDALNGAGIRAWHDEHSLVAGEDMQDAISKGIKDADRMILCCSEESLKSWWVERELNTAFTKEQRHLKERGEKQLYLIPIDLDGYIFSPNCETSRAEEVRTRKIASFRDWKRTEGFEEAFKNLLTALRAAIVTDKRHRYKPGERFNPFRF